MITPIVDFVRRYADSDTARLHMPGHKGQPILGCEPMDITEIRGADALYEADGIIAESEAIATRLFASARTVYSAEGSSQCIRAMLALCLMHRPAGSSRIILAARNVHKAFVYAAALLDADIRFLPVSRQTDSLCACAVSPEDLSLALAALPTPPAAVYITCPDYLGGMADVRALSAVCHAHGTVLAVDNAHGAYLRFLTPSLHPLSLGADLCCDSAHKTLPVLTGGAYLHIGTDAPDGFVRDAKQAMALFGSTSPSYLILASLDQCNALLAGGYAIGLAQCVRRIEALRGVLRARGWVIPKTDPLKLTVDAAASGTTGHALAARLASGGCEPEFADEDYLVLMLTPQNTERDLDRLLAALGSPSGTPREKPPLSLLPGERVCSVREAFFAPHEYVPAAQAVGRICGAPTVSCPPAIPIVLSGERITAQAADLFARFGIETVCVLCG